MRTRLVQSVYVKLEFHVQTEKRNHMQPGIAFQPKEWKRNHIPAKTWHGISDLRQFSRNFADLHILMRIYMDYIFVQS